LAERISLNEGCNIKPLVENIFEEQNWWSSLTRWSIY